MEKKEELVREIRDQVEHDLIYWSKHEVEEDEPIEMEEEENEDDIFYDAENDDDIPDDDLDDFMVINVDEEEANS